MEHVERVEGENVSRTLTPVHRIARKPTVPWKELDGVAVIMNLETGDYFELDEMGLHLWKRIEHETPLSAIAAHLAATYDVAPDVALSDATAFFEELWAKDLIVVR